MSCYRELMEDISYDGDVVENLLDLVRSFISGSYGDSLNKLFLTAFAFIEENTNLDERDGEGNTAIFYIIKCRDLWTILPHLCEKCDVNIVNNKGFTPLHIAAQQETTFPTEMLYNANASIVSDGRGHYPVDIARIYNRGDIISFYE